MSVDIDFKCLYENLYSEFLKMEQRFLVYQSCINKIDDYLEYQWREKSAGEIRKHILGILDHLTERLKEL